MAADARVVGALFLDQAGALWPYYLSAVFFAALIKTFRWDLRVRASLGRFERGGIVVAVGAGLLSPLCSCGILPVVIALSAAGVSLPPVLALLITSPLMSPEAFLVTAGELGLTFALWKLGAAAAVGFAAGFGALWLVRRGVLPAAALRPGAVFGDHGHPQPGFGEVAAAGCFAHAGEGGGTGGTRSLFLFFAARFRDMAFLIGKFLAVALLVQAAVTYYVPANLVEPVLGRRSALSVFFAALLSVPLPLNQVAAPVVIKGLLGAGMAPGAAMAMLVGGPVTSVPALSALAAAYDRRVFALYTGIGIFASVFAGLLFQAVYG